MAAFLPGATCWLEKLDWSFLRRQSGHSTAEKSTVSQEVVKLFKKMSRRFQRPGNQKLAKYFKRISTKRRIASREE